MSVVQWFDDYEKINIVLRAVLNPVYLVRAFYLVCTTAILCARLLQPLRQRFLAYGARAQRQVSDETNHGQHKHATRSSARFLDGAAAIQVPHGWFTHFYIVSVASSCSWLFLLFGPVRNMYPRHFLPQNDFTSQSSQSALLCMVLMLLQGIRRLLESLRFSKSSTSTMWIGHYVFGMAFYFFTNIATWIESTGDSDSPITGTLFAKKSLATLPSKITVGLFIFVLASAAQLTAHAYLASLRRYTLPSHWLFQRLIAPHYTAECAIYLSLAMIGAPEDSLLNRTLLCSAIVTVVNLGITAKGTKQWMLGKFRDQRQDIERRWTLLPVIF